MMHDVYMCVCAVRSADGAVLDACCVKPGLGAALLSVPVQLIGCMEWMLSAECVRCVGCTTQHEAHSLQHVHST